MKVKVGALSKMVLLVLIPLLFLSPGSSVLAQAETPPEAEPVGVALLLGALAALSMLLYAVVELMIGSWLPWIWPGESEEVRKRRSVVMQLLTAVVGVAFTVGYRLDLFALVLRLFNGTVTVTYEPWISTIGMIVTGLLIGRGSNWFHDIASTFGGIRSVIKEPLPDLPDSYFYGSGSLN